MVVIFNASMSKKLQEIKSDENNQWFKEWLESKNIFMNIPKYGTSKIAHAGYLLNVHTMIVWRHALKEALDKAIQEIPKETMLEIYHRKERNDNKIMTIVKEDENENIIPKYDIKKATIRMKGSKEKRVEGTSTSIQCAVEDFEKIIEIFAYLDENNKLPQGKFLPAGSVANMDPIMYQHIIANHNQDLKSQVSIPIGGLTWDELNSITFRGKTIKEKLLEQDVIQSVEPTQIEGKLLIVTT